MIAQLCWRSLPLSFNQCTFTIMELISVLLCPQIMLSEASLFAGQMSFSHTCSSAKACLWIFSRCYFVFWGTSIGHVAYREHCAFPQDSQGSHSPAKTWKTPGILGIISQFMLVLMLQMDMCCERMIMIG